MREICSTSTILSLCAIAARVFSGWKLAFLFLPTCCVGRHRGDSATLWGLWRLCSSARVPQAYLNSFSRQLTATLMPRRGAEPVQFFIRIKSLALSRWGSRMCFRCGTRCALTSKQGLEEQPKPKQVNIVDRCIYNRWQLHLHHSRSL